MLRRGNSTTSSALSRTIGFFNPHAKRFASASAALKDTILADDAVSKMLRERQPVKKKVMEAKGGTTAARALVYMHRVEPKSGKRLPSAKSPLVGHVSAPSTPPSRSNSSKPRTAKSKKVELFTPMTGTMTDRFLKIQMAETLQQKERKRKEAAAAAAAEEESQGVVWVDDLTEKIKQEAYDAATALEGNNLVANVASTYAVIVPKKSAPDNGKCGIIMNGDMTVRSVPPSSRAFGLIPEGAAIESVDGKPVSSPKSCLALLDSSDNKEMIVMINENPSPSASPAAAAVTRAATNTTTSAALPSSCSISPTEVAPHPETKKQKLVKIVTAVCSCSPFASSFLSRAAAASSSAPLTFVSLVFDVDLKKGDSGGHWGVHLNPDMTVRCVDPRSQAAGLVMVGNKIEAVQGVPVATPEACLAAIEAAPAAHVITINTDPSSASPSSTTPLSCLSTGVFSRSWKVVARGGKNMRQVGSKGWMKTHMISSRCCSSIAAAATGKKENRKKHFLAAGLLLTLSVIAAVRSGTLTVTFTPPSTVANFSELKESLSAAASSMVAACTPAWHKLSWSSTSPTVAPVEVKDEVVVPSSSAASLTKDDDDLSTAVAYGRLAFAVALLKAAWDLY